jgi:hypothetical protein
MQNRFRTVEGITSIRGGSDGLVMGPMKAPEAAKVEQSVRPIKMSIVRDNNSKNAEKHVAPAERSDA